MTRSAIGLALATGVVVALASCERELEGDLHFRLNPKSREPGFEDFRQRWINGQCYLSNGVVCIPCAGGLAVRCSEIAPAEMPIAPQPRPWYMDTGDPPSGLEQQLFVLTGGWDGPSWQLLWGWSDWSEGDEIEGPYFLNLYTDQGHAAADGTLHDEWLDVSFLWRADWVLPGDEGPLPAGVSVAAYLDGEFGDGDPADLMLLRVAGPPAAVQAALEPLRLPGTDYVIELPGGGEIP